MAAGATITNAILTVDLSNKTYSATATLAIRETVYVKLANIGESAATNLCLRLVRETNAYANATNFVASDSTNAYGALDLNTTELVNYFTGLNPTASRQFSLAVWDTSLGRLLVNDYISVQNNPYDPTMPGPSPVGVIYLVDAPSTNGPYCRQSNMWVAATNIVGPTGPQGPAGPAGTNAIAVAYNEGSTNFASVTGSTNLHISFRSNYATGTPVYAESDPVWLAQKSGYATGTPVYVESDPIWSASSTGYYSKTETDAKYSTGTPLYVEFDPDWSAASTGYYSKTESDIKYATGTPLYVYSETDPAWTGVSNDVVYKANTQGWETGSHAGLATGTPLYVYTETDPAWSGASTGYYTKTEAEGLFSTGTPVYVETDPEWTSEKANYALQGSLNAASNMMVAVDAAESNRAVAAEQSIGASATNALAFAQSESNRAVAAEQSIGASATNALAFAQSESNRAVAAEQSIGAYATGVYDFVVSESNRAITAEQSIGTSVTNAYNFVVSESNRAVTAEQSIGTSVTNNYNFIVSESNRAVGVEQQLGTSVTNLNTATNSLNTAVGSLQTSTGTLNTAVGALNTATNSINGRLEIVETNTVPLGGAEMYGPLTNKVSIWGHYFAGDGSGLTNLAAPTATNSDALGGQSAATWAAATGSLNTAAANLNMSTGSLNTAVAALNTATNSLQTQININMPVGVILAYGTSNAPTGWLLCDGAAVSRSTYAALFGVVGTTYGAGDASTTFNVPNLVERFPLGHTNLLGVASGVSSVTLTIDQIPAHTHNLAMFPGENESYPTRPRGKGDDPSSGTRDTSSAGGGLAHTNMPPNLTVNYIIKY